MIFITVSVYLVDLQHIVFQLFCSLVAFALMAEFVTMQSNEDAVVEYVDISDSITVLLIVQLASYMSGTR